MPTFAHSYRVTYADCTLGNHIYYGRYLEILEAARGEFVRHLGTTFLVWQQKGFAFPVIECRLKYRVPAEYDDALRIEVSVLSAKGARLGFAYRILNQQMEIVLEGETLHACTDLTGKPRRLPEPLAALLNGNAERG